MLRRASCCSRRAPIGAGGAREAGVSRPAVWRWQRRFGEEGVEGLLHGQDASARHATTPGPYRRRGSGADLFRTAGRGDPLDGTRRGQGVGISLRSVQRIWNAHHLQPHRLRTFKRSHDPAFAEKVEDIVGLYMDPPAHAVVLSIDEKSQIQALERTRPGTALAEGHPASQTHDYVRHGTTTLFAALNVLEGTVLGRCMQRHRHGEFIRFLNAVEAAVPPGKLVHVVLDNYATHKHPKVRAWLARHPRWTFHFTPTSASWMNAVEGFFSALTRRRLRRRHIPRRRRPASRHQALHCRAQPQHQTIRLDETGGRHPRCRQSSACTSV